ncbi:NADPH-dependent F420 reductase [Streptomyces johnsoniae]|uniref:NAD(P)-binding domain-containing protein n=1 Tax=Streptomyces johnsoniae TaxID=3075532 RepID=A0ABU2S4B8_9ACTN|nr:NAD(P)-binding domain-containing protein [Streptomyces sp. DSM 41886]MDT0443826.1 NAD(P)-binding domain-containing protein [Streptomyces sp. DSM 41886]
MRIGIIGAGGMGGAIARRAALAGASVLLADRSQDRARRAAALAVRDTPGAVRPATVAGALRPQLIVLALGWRESLGLIESRGRALAGRTLVDVTVPTGRHATANGVRALAGAAPGARWVKAFATADSRALFAGEIDRRPVDVFVASDDDRAKLSVIELVDRSGLRALDVGGLDNARVLEEMARIGQEMRERLLITGGWSFQFLPSW